jgi:hypothetical protein
MSDSSSVRTNSGSIMNRDCNVNLLTTLLGVRGGEKWRTLKYTCVLVHKVSVTLKHEISWIQKRVRFQEQTQ